MLRISVLAVAALLAATGHPAAQTAADSRVAIFDGRITVELPTGWSELSPIDLEDISIRVADTTAGRAVELYQYGFHPPDFEDDPWLPHILVQARQSGRPDATPFLRLPSLEDLRSSTAQTYPDGLPPLIVGVAVERVAFDRERMIVTLEHALDLKFKGRVRVLTAALLTEEGIVAFYFTDREHRIDESRRLFRNLIDSVRIDPAIAYRLRLTDRWPGLPFFAAAAIAAIGLAAYVAHRRRRTP